MPPFVVTVAVLPAMIVSVTVAVSSSSSAVPSGPESVVSATFAIA